jgi:RNAse (barnase) inhibitor barstar
MKNLQLLPEESLPEGFDLVYVDASTTPTLRAFYEVMAETLEFPDYFGFNLDSFDELINDLSWIENEKLFLYFTNSEDFLKSERNEAKILTLLDLLDAACEEWKWRDDEEKAVLLGFSPSARMEKLLGKEA